MQTGKGESVASYDEQSQCAKTDIYTGQKGNRTLNSVHISVAVWPTTENPKDSQELEYNKDQDTWMV